MEGEGLSKRQIAYPEETNEGNTQSTVSVEGSGTACEGEWHNKRKNPYYQSEREGNNKGTLRGEGEGQELEHPFEHDPQLQHTPKPTATKRREQS